MGSVDRSYQLSVKATLSSLRVLVVDDHRLVAEGVKYLLQPHCASVEILSSGEALLDEVVRDRPGLVVLDMAMPGLDGLQTLARLRALGCQAPVVVLTMYDDAALAMRALEAGAIGYVTKISAGDELIQAIQFAIQGLTFISSGLVTAHAALRRQKLPTLTPHQLVVLQMTALGLRPMDISNRLGVSRRTVESHKLALMRKLGVHSSVELLRAASLAGLVDLGSPECSGSGSAVAAIASVGQEASPHPTGDSPVDQRNAHDAGAGT